MTELLAPAGGMEALKAAISNGADAIYLGLQKFGARAYSSNFDFESLQEAIAYAHLRRVKIYITMNTIVFPSEIEEMKQFMQELNRLGVDAIIVQDLSALRYVKDHFPDIEVHCSTQMGIDDIDGARLMKELGADRIVLAREVPIEDVKEIRRQVSIPLELFVHGALCVSYSGNCLMSGLIGYRSGNRGRCVGSCRKEYDLIDETLGQSLGKSYLLSTKDLKTIEFIEDLKAVDSLKIEGRMKEPAYVANVVSKYRKALDGSVTKEDQKGLLKTFNRTYTKGYLFHEDQKDITNTKRPNNFGYEIGRVSQVLSDAYELSLLEPLHQNDIIRIDHSGEDIILNVVKLYDKAGRLVNRADKVCHIKVKERLSKGDVVYLTKDAAYYKELEMSLEGEFRKFPLELKLEARPGQKLHLEGTASALTVGVSGEELLEAALTNPTTYAQTEKQLGKLGDTIFELASLEFSEEGAFVPVKVLNQARRELVSALYELILKSKQKRQRQPESSKPICFTKKDPRLTASVTTKEQYDACQKSGIATIYFENTVRRNQNQYKEIPGQLLLGGFGGIHHYRQTNPFVTDYSLNVVNAESCYELYKLGAERVTLSYEINKAQIEELIASYEKQNGGSPALEMIIYGRAPLMFTKYCPLKKMDQCGNCKKHHYELRDEHGSFPVISHDDCSTTILNGKILNLLDEMPELQGIEAFRLNFTIESPEEVEQVISKARAKLEGKLSESVFQKQTDTRGHFNKEIL